MCAMVISQCSEDPGADAHSPELWGGKLDGIWASLQLQLSRARQAMCCMLAIQQWCPVGYAGLSGSAFAVHRELDSYLSLLP